MNKIPSFPSTTYTLLQEVNLTCVQSAPGSKHDINALYLLTINRMFSLDNVNRYQNARL